MKKICDYKCLNCPIRIIKWCGCISANKGKNISEQLESYKKISYEFYDEEIYHLLKKRIEVKE